MCFVIIKRTKWLNICRCHPISLNIKYKEQCGHTAPIAKLIFKTFGKIYDLENLEFGKGISVYILSRAFGSAERNNNSESFGGYSIIYRMAHQIGESLMLSRFSFITNDLAVKSLCNFARIIARIVIYQD